MKKDGYDVAGPTGASAVAEEGGERSHLSVSQVKLAQKCSLAYRYHYVDNLPAPEEAASKVFGTVVHNGTEKWYGTEGDGYKSTNLRDYVHEEWFEWLPSDVAIELRHCIEAERHLADLEQLIMIGRPQIKAPRQTKDFVVSEPFKQAEDARDGLLAAMTKCTDMRWPKDENALQAWQKSMHIANQLQERWQRHPRPLVIERGFVIEFAGVEIRGRIDQIRVDPDPEGQVQVQGLDLKTGRQPLTQMDAFLQAFLYNEACYYFEDLPVPDYWTFHLARQNKPQHGHIDRERHGQLAARILHHTRQQIQEIRGGDYAPAYGMWCKSCDFKELCEAEIGMWPVGEDSAVLEIA